MSLRDGHWEEVERYCSMLGRYSAHEPFPWADFVMARGRALSRAGRGETGLALVVTLESLQRQATSSEGNLYLPEIDTALARLLNRP